MKILDTIARYVFDVCKISETEEQHIEYHELNLPETKKSQNEMLSTGWCGNSLRFFMKEEHVKYFQAALRACDGAIDAGNYFLIPIPLKLIEGHLTVPLTRPKRNGKYYIQVSVIDINKYNKLLQGLRSHLT